MSVDDLLDFAQLPYVDNLKYKLIRVISLKLVFVYNYLLLGIDDLLDFTELSNVDHLQYKLISVIPLKLVFVHN